jgi:aspartate 1-decarboxylase
MQIQLLKSKILRAEVTDSSVDYEGSLGIDTDLMDRVGLLPYEKILVGDITNGSRFETYAIPAPAGSRTIALNGAVAHLGKIGDLLVIMSFASLTPEEALTWKPKTIVVAECNSKIIKAVNA